MIAFFVLPDMFTRFFLFIKSFFFKLKLDILLFQLTKSITKKIIYLMQAINIILVLQLSKKNYNPQKLLILIRIIILIQKLFYQNQIFTKIKKI